MKNKRTIGKRILSLLLTLCMVSAIAPEIVMPKAAAANGVMARIDSLRSMFPSGSYFSKNGAACGHGQGYTCTNCELKYILQRSDLSGLGYVAGTDYTDAWTCIAFSRFAYRYIYGNKCVAGNYTQVASGSFSQATFSKASIGDLILFYSSSGARLHAAIFVGNVTSTSVGLYHSNFGAANKISYGNWSYSGMMSSYGSGGYAVICHANNYDAVNGSTPPPANPVPPTVSASASGSTVNVSWNAVANATSYDVYLIQDPWGWNDVRQSGSTNGTSYSFSNVGDGGYCVFVVSRPNANSVQSNWASVTVSSAPPSNLAISIPKTSYFVNEDVQFSLSASNTTKYTIGIDKDGQRLVTDTLDWNGSTTYTFKPTEMGNYSAYISAGNANGWVDSSRVNFTVYRLSEPTLSSNKTAYQTGENVVLSWSGISGATLYDYYVTQYPEGWAYEVNTKIGTVTGTSVSFSDLPVGKYSAFVHAKNNITASLQSNWISFTVDEAAYTPEKTVYYNGSKYELYDVGTSWTYANEICKRLGGHLVAITSAAENDVVKQLVQGGKKYYWLGANNRFNVDGAEKDSLDFVWTDGEAFSYSNWAAGEPSHSHEHATEERYAHIYSDSGEWNDYKNVPTDWLGEFGFICEYPADTCTVTFDPNGGSVEIGSKEVTINGTYGTLPTPVRSGYRFIGWSRSKTSTVMLTESSSVTESGDHKLYAIWEKEVTFAQMFPDANFRAYVTGTVLKDSAEPKGDNDVVSAAQMQAIAACGAVEVRFKKITSLQGIEYFTALTTLECDYNQLTSLDVSENTALGYLNCNSNQLTSLDVSKNTELDQLWCADNQLTSLDVSKNTKLYQLWCSGNQLTSLDVSGNGRLGELWCHDNQLTSLDVFNNTALVSLYCHTNQLTSLDVSQNTALTELCCYNNHLAALYLGMNTNLFYSKDVGIPGFEAYNQTLINTTVKPVQNGSNWTVDIGALLDGHGDIKKVTMTDGSFYNATTGIALYTEKPTKVTYSYNHSGPNDLSEYPLEVTWTPSAYQESSKITIYFNANGGTCARTSRNVTVGSAYGYLPPATRDGYVFDGWYTAVSGGTKVTEETVVSKTINHVLYAHWTEKMPTRETVTFSGNGSGATISRRTRNVYTGSAYGTLPSAVREGYLFTGWFTAPTGGTLVTADTIVTIEGDHVLYAHWTESAPIRETVTFSGNGSGSVISRRTRNVYTGSAYGALPTASRTGYSFLGWFTEAEGGTQITEDTIVTIVGNHALYAHWASIILPVRETVTFSGNGSGSVISRRTRNVYTGSAYGTLPTANREGYTFEGWYTASVGGTKVTEDTIVTIQGDHALYAHWTEN